VAAAHRYRINVIPAPLAVFRSKVTVLAHPAAAAEQATRQSAKSASVPCNGRKAFQTTSALSTISSLVRSSASKA